MYLFAAIGAYLGAAVCLYYGIETSSWWLLIMAALLMGMGKTNIKRYKQSQ